MQLALWGSYLAASWFDPHSTFPSPNNVPVSLPTCLSFAIELHRQRAKKVVSDSPWLMDFAIGLVNSVFTFPDGQVTSFEEFE